MGRHAGRRNRRPGPFPALGGLEIRPAGSLRAPRRDREALTQVRWLHASQSPPAPMQRRQVGSPGFNELPPLQADKTQPTRGAARRHPGEPRPHPTTSRVTHLKPTTHCSALGSSKSQTTTPNSRSSLWRMTDALQAAGPGPLKDPITGILPTALWEQLIRMRKPVPGPRPERKEGPRPEPRLV